MSRCGCAGACDCILVAGQGIRVPGTGSISQPFVISARSSQDAGNCLRFGSDGGLYAPCSDDETQDICGISVANLPEERLVFGRGGAGRLLAPDSTLESFRRAVDLGLDASHAHLRELGDGTPVCFPNSEMTNQTALEGLTIFDLGVNGYKNVPIRAGWNPEVTANLGGRHGFFDFGEPDRVGGTTLADVLDAVGRRSVIAFEMIGPFSAGFPEKVLSLIFRYCAQEAVIIASHDINDLDIFNDAGIQTGLFVSTEAIADENPPSMLVDRGVEWLFGRLQDVTTGQFIAYSSAGLHTVGYMASRHYEWQYLDSIGARGVISDDGIYMTMDPDRYRLPAMANTLSQPQVQPGMLGFWTDPRRYLESGPGQPGEVYWPAQGRGFYFPRDHTAADAYYMPRRGTLATPEPDGTPYRTSSGVFDVSMGFVNPIPWDDYTMDVEVSYRDTPGINRPMGMLLGLNDDRAFDDRDGAGDAYWAVGIRWSGSLFVERWENQTLQGSQSVGTSQLVEDEFYLIRTIVNPVSVTIQRIDSGGGVVNEATVADSATRGGYSSFFKNERSGGTWYPFAAAWRNLAIYPNAMALAAEGGEVARMPLRASGPREVEDLSPWAREIAPGELRKGRGPGE